MEAAFFKSILNFYADYFMKLKLNLLQIQTLKRGHITGIIISILIGSPTIAQPNSPNADALVSPTSTSATTKTVQLTLSDAIALLLQNNQDLKNAALDRIVQRQQLREAENAFTPTIQPILGLGMSQTFSNSTPGASLSSSTSDTTTNTTSSSSAFNTTTDTTASSSESSISGSDNLSTASIDTFPPNSTFTQTAQVSGRLRTPLGTTLTLTVDPFQSQGISATVTQPLLRGFGSDVNEAPVKRARYNETFNSLELRKTLSDQITQTSISYRALARAQEALRIQQLSLENQRQQLEFVQVLVDAGRRARADLVEVEANIASTQTQLIAARNSLEQAESDLLNLLDVEETDIVVPQKLIEQFRAGVIPVNNTNALTLNRLLEIAYTNRPEYLQAKSSIQMAELDLLIARDNKRFSLDLQASATIGENSEMSTGLSLTRVFGDESLETAFQQNRVDLLKRQNELTKIESDIQIEVESRLRDVNSSRERITAARRARELAERRLEITKERFRLGREDIFQVVSLQNAVVTAQNEEVNAKIDFLDAVTRLDQAIGVTLNTWKEEIVSSGLLATSPEPFSATVQN